MAPRFVPISFWEPNPNPLILDKNPTSKEMATRKFKQIGEAKAILTDRNKREMYDHHGVSGSHHHQHEFNPDQFFNQFCEFFAMVVYWLIFHQLNNADLRGPEILETAKQGSSTLPRSFHLLYYSFFLSSTQTRVRSQIFPSTAALSTPSTVSRPTAAFLILHLLPSINHLPRLLVCSKSKVVSKIHFYPQFDRGILPLTKLQ